MKLKMWWPCFPACSLKLFSPVWDTIKSRVVVSTFFSLPNYPSYPPKIGQGLRHVPETFHFFPKISQKQNTQNMHSHFNVNMYFREKVIWFPWYLHWKKFLCIYQSRYLNTISIRNLVRILPWWRFLQWWPSKLRSPWIVKEIQCERNY